MKAKILTVNPLLQTEGEVHATRLPAMKIKTNFERAAVGGVVVIEKTFFFPRPTSRRTPNQEFPELPTHVL